MSNDEFQDLNALLLQRVEAKRQEDAAVEKRKLIDSNIAVLMEKDLRERGKETGQVTKRAEKIGLKCTVTFATRVAVDQKAVASMFDELPQAVQDIFSICYEASATKLRALSQRDLILASSLVSESVAAPSIKIEVM